MIAIPCVECGEWTFEHYGLLGVCRRCWVQSGKCVLCEDGLDDDRITEDFCFEGLDVKLRVHSSCAREWENNQTRQALSDAASPGL